MVAPRTFSALVLLVALLSAGPAAAGSSPPVPTLNWAPCGDDAPGAECAVAAVPLDYDTPAGETIDLALARIPASAPKIGTVFVNPGGPGVSGVDLVLLGFGDVLAGLLQGRFDVVGFDPRGVARSEGLQCFATNEDQAAFFAGLPVFPFETEQEQQFFDTYNAFARSCVGSGQRIIAHMSTADVARDLDVLRQAVGDKKLTYLGFSYGSYIGSTYANLFPGKVRALVIDGVLDPVLWSNGREIQTERFSTQQEFDEFLRLCDEAGPDRCPLTSDEGAAARWDGLVDVVRASPLVLPDGSVITYDVLVLQAVLAMTAPELWGGPEGFGALFGALADFALGDGLAGGRAARARSAIASVLDRSLADEGYNNLLEGFYGSHCSDAEFPLTLAAFRTMADFGEAGSIFGRLWWWNDAAPCAVWPTASDRYAGPWKTDTSSPVLVVGNFFDGITGYDGAVAVSRLLENSRLLSYAGWGHTAFGRSACVTDHVARYLRDGTLPPAGTVCPANPNPFVVAPSLVPLAASPAVLIGLPALPGR